MIIIAEDNEDYLEMCNHLRIDSDLHTMVSYQSDIYTQPILSDGVSVVAIGELPNDLTAHDMFDMTCAGYNVIWLSDLETVPSQVK